MKCALRPAVLLALACASLPVAAAETVTSAAPPATAENPPGPSPVAPAPGTNGPLVPLALPLQPTLPATEAPVTGGILTLDLAPPSAPAEAATPTAAPGSSEFAPARPIPAMTTGEETFARLRRQLGAGACDAGSNSARWRERYAGNRVAFSRRLQSVLPLLDFVSLEVERAKLPAEFTFIPLVESWFQPGAMGPGGPAGMWQMIGSTARNHGIHIREGYDGRLSPVESTRAALSYLKVLQDMFGNWQAIVMAYNAGEGRMQNALRRAGSRVTSAAERRPHGLSNITYDYVAKLQALSCLVSQPQRYGLHLPVETRFEPLVPLLMDPGMQSLDAFALARGKDPEQLKRLNPGFRNGRVIAGVPRLVLAPPGASVAASTVADVAQATSAEPLASTYGDGEREFAELLESALAVEGGDVATIAPELDLPGALGTLEAVPVADFPASRNPDQPLQPEPEAIAASGFTDPPTPLHEVREGESLGSIAKYYQLPIEQIRQANGLDKKAMLHPGQVLRLVP
jgi:membrane-bound lytic murein transglycosylase D